MSPQMINLKRSRPESYEPAEPEREVLPARRNWKKLVLLAVVLLAVAKGFFLWQEKGVWRAVFLTNNQVYFGKFIPWPFAGTITLKDIYYLQVNQGIQPQDGTNQPALNLVKLGKEIHAPKDEMVIPRGQILYWEDLRTDGAVVQAILKYEAENK